MKFVVGMVLALVLALASAFYVGERMDQKAQAQAVESFYTAVIEMNIRDVATKEQIEKLTPFITSKLRSTLLETLAAEEKFIKEAEQASEPMASAFEGPLFFYVWEGPNKMLGVKPESVAGQTSYRVMFQMAKPYDTDPKNNWEDRAILVKENGKWVIDELQFGIGDGSTPNHSLSEKLKQRS
jgi:hypothetical protein